MFIPFKKTINKHTGVFERENESKKRRIRRIFKNILLKISNTHS